MIFLKNYLFIFVVTAFLVLSTVVVDTDCCSSKSKGYQNKSRNNISTFVNTLAVDQASSSKADMTTTNTISTTQTESSNQKIPQQSPKIRNESKQVFSDDYDETNNADTFSNLPAMSKCLADYAIHYCLNGGKCLSYAIENYSMPTCQCADGYLGERCEAKYTTVNLYHQMFPTKAACVWYGTAASLSLAIICAAGYFLWRCLCTDAPSPQFIF